MTKKIGHNIHMAITKDKASISRTSKKSYALGQAKTHLSEIVDHVEATGEEIILTRHGKAVARLVPDWGAGPRPLGFARGRVKFKKGWDQPLTYKELFGE